MVGHRLSVRSCTAPAFLFVYGFIRTTGLLKGTISFSMRSKQSMMAMFCGQNINPSAASDTRAGHLLAAVEPNDEAELIIRLIRIVEVDQVVQSIEGSGYADAFRHTFAQ